MNREEWIKEKRYMAEKRYDTIFSVDYDKNWGQIEKQHEDNLIYFLTLLPYGAAVLDAACGTGKYWSIIRHQGYDILGIDQSQKMLDNAVKKFPDICVEKRGLQDIEYDSRFYGIICIDAMENIFPEQWVLVLRNFYNALKSNGYVYFTVETMEKNEIEYSLAKSREKGLPVLEGEYAHEGGYHYYPSIEKVREWLHSVNFVIEKENISEGYYHFIVKK